jgi:hypothetical protein
VLEWLERASPAERRQLLDSAREKAGLLSTGDVLARKRFEAANYIARTRPVSSEDPPPEARLKVTAGGAIVPGIDQAELEREQRRDRAAAEARRQRREEAEYEARELAASRQAEAEAWQFNG